MTPPSQWSDAQLWADLNEHIQATRGAVGIIKMMKVRDEEEGAQVWADRVRPVLERLQSLLPVNRVSAACYSLTDGVTVQFDIHSVTIESSGHPTVWTMILMDPAAVTLGVIGQHRWGMAWNTSLAAVQPVRAVVRRDGAATNAADFPWVAQNPGGPAPWTAAVSEEIAALAGRSEDLGFERVATLFAEMENEVR